EQGPKGDTGEQGLQGIQGLTGADGKDGAKGEKGEVGAKGDTGAQGPQGLKGDPGAKGDQGPRGADGINGSIGAQGPQGPAGPTGADGATGSQGPQGPPGDPATNDQDLTLISNILSLTGDPTPDPIDLSGYLDNTDEQKASEVDLDIQVDVDGDGTKEDTVEAVIQAIAPITAKAARIFYPPSIAVDASSAGNGRTINLYDQYTAQFGSPAVSSTGAPTAIPTYASDELYYYVTHFDPAVFSNVSISASGVMTYNVIAVPADYNSLINVVFVVK
ncbi:MAG TPA: hypothetical protein VLZ54_04215, partial [Arenibacter sp.]|nr:hypothetical protein [Arenibacter sp.]